MSGFLSSGIVNADTIPDSATFEHNDLTGNYGGDTGNFQIQNSTVDEGSYALQKYQNNRNFDAIVRSTKSSFTRDDLRMDFAAYYPSSPTGIGGVAIATSVTGWSNLDGYLFRADSSAGIQEIVRVNNGTRSDLTSAGSGTTQDQWVSGTIKLFSDDSFEFTLDGNTITAGSDSTYSDFYLSFVAFGEFYVDDVQFSSI